MKLLAVVAVLLSLVFAVATLPAPAGGNAPDQAGPVVRVMVGKGHGTGVHIGNGYILTVEHVIDESADAPKDKPVPITIRDDRGADATAELLWATKVSDVALLRIANATLAAAPLSCRAVAVGETITTTGNPLSLEFVTYAGRVAGTARNSGKWASVVPVTGIGRAKVSHFREARFPPSAGA